MFFDEILHFIALSIPLRHQEGIRVINLSKPSCFGWTSIGILSILKQVQGLRQNALLERVVKRERQELRRIWSRWIPCCTFAGWQFACIGVAGIVGKGINVGGLWNGNGLRVAGRYQQR